MAHGKPIDSTPGGQGRFATTHWSVVLAAVRSFLSTLRTPRVSTPSNQPTN